MSSARIQTQSMALVAAALLESVGPNFRPPLSVHKHKVRGGRHQRVRGDFPGLLSHMGATCYTGRENEKGSFPPVARHLNTRGMR